MYINFLSKNAHLFETYTLRRSSRVFLALSKAMKGVRTSHQCKSHHQKMQRHTSDGSVYQIITYLKKKYINKLKGNTSINRLSLPEIEEKDEPVKPNYRILSRMFPTYFDIRVEFNWKLLPLW